MRSRAGAIVLFEVRGKPATDFPGGCGAQSNGSIAGFSALSGQRFEQLGFDFDLLPVALQFGTIDQKGVFHPFA